MSVDVVLYGRPKCCLCDEAEMMLHHLRSEFGFVLTKINIDDHKDLTEKYGLQIPVITFNGAHRLTLRITPERLRRSLQKAQAI
jgi:glutaredoxin